MVEVASDLTRVLCLPCERKEHDGVHPEIDDHPVGVEKLIKVQQELRSAGALPITVESVSLSVTPETEPLAMKAHLWCLRGRLQYAREGGLCFRQ